MRIVITLLCFVFLGPALADADDVITDDVIADDAVEDVGGKAVGDLIRATVEKVLAVLQKDDMSRLDKRERVMKIIKPHVDFELMAKRALPSKMWAAMNAEQRKTFTDLFVETIKRSYFEKLVLFSDETVEFGEPVAKKTRRPAYSVVTHVVSKGDRVEVVYALTQSRDEEKKEEVWKVYDFEIEGVSLRSSYRSQYKDFLKDRPLEDLLDAMRKKVDDAKQKEAAEEPKKAGGK